MTKFTEKAPWIVANLMRDFDLTVDEASAIVGNLGHETAGFEYMQEIGGNPGGYGWPMWTGARRIAYLSYCSRNNLDPACDRANYGYLWVELKGSEKRGIEAVRSPGTLEHKTNSFQDSFERAGVPAYASRQIWARRARAAYVAAKARGEALPLPWAAELPPAPLPEGPTSPKPETEQEKALWQLLVELYQAIIALYKS